MGTGSQLTGESVRKFFFPVRSKCSSYRDIELDPDTTRGHWTSKTEFLLSCIGLAVGLGNLWRFPTLAYQNGGAAFFIPYIILQVLIGKPLFLMELAIGQYAGQGPIGVFKMNPGARGIGIAMVYISFWVVIYYISIMALSLFYMFASLQSTLPWTYCKKEWLDKCCYVRIGDGKSISKCSSDTINATLCQNQKLCKCSGNATWDFNPISCSESVKVASSGASYSKLMELAKVNCSALQVCTNNTNTPSHFYFYEEVIRKTDQMDQIGSPIWHITLCLLLAWIIVLMCVIRGIKSSGKVVYFTATFPYIVILILLIRSASLTGAVDGIKYFLIPDWSKLGDIKVWKAAGGQMFFSLGVSYGPLITMGSFNVFRNNVYSDAIIISMCDIGTSFLSGLVVFSTLGAMAYDTGVEISKVAQTGFGLVFVTYPEALSALPGSQFFSFIFFFMLFTLGVDSEFGYVETVIMTIVDEYPKLLPYKMRITVFTGFLCFLVGLSLVTPGGTHVVDLIDNFVASYPLYLVSFGELAAIAWVYGINNFFNDVETMVGHKPHMMMYWKATLAVIAPLLVGIIFILSLAFYSTQELEENVPIPKWAQAIGWLLFLSATLPMPIYFLYSTFMAKADTLWERIKLVSKPSGDWGPQKHDYGDLLLQKKTSKENAEPEKKISNQKTAMQSNDTRLAYSKDPAEKPSDSQVSKSKRKRSKKNKEKKRNDRKSFDDLQEEPEKND